MGVFQDGGKTKMLNKMIFSSEAALLAVTCPMIMLIEVLSSWIKLVTICTVYAVCRGQENGSSICSADPIFEIQMK